MTDWQKVGFQFPSNGKVDSTSLTVGGFFIPPYVSIPFKRESGLSKKNGERYHATLILAGARSFNSLQTGKDYKVWKRVYV